MNKDFFGFRKLFDRTEYHGLRVGILVSALYAYFKLNNKSSIQYLCSSLKKIFTTPIIKFVEGEGWHEKLPIFTSIDRSDYAEITAYVEKQLSSVVKVGVNKTTFKDSVSTPRELVNCLRRALMLSKAYSSKWYESVFIFSSFFYILKGIHRLENGFQRIPMSAIFFNSSSFPESLLCEYIRAKGGITFSLQHGMYMRPQKINYDIVNVANVMADNMLCWGQFSKQEIESFYSENGLFQRFNCVVAGYPRDKFLSKYTSLYEDKVFVVLPRVLYKREILVLLEVLSTAGFQGNAIVKLHPSLTGDEDILRACEKLNAEMAHGTLSQWLGPDKYRAIIGFNTTSLFECIESSKKVLVFESGCDEFPNRLFSVFSSKNSLSLLLESDDELRPDYCHFFAHMESGYVDSVCTSEGACNTQWEER